MDFRKPETSIGPLKILVRTAYLCVDRLCNFTGISRGHVCCFGYAVDDSCEGVIFVVPEDTAVLHVLQIRRLTCQVACLDGIPLDLFLTLSCGVHVFGAGGHGINDEVKDCGDRRTDRVFNLGWVL